MNAALKIDPISQTLILWSIEKKKTICFFINYWFERSMSLINHYANQIEKRKKLDVPTFFFSRTLSLVIDNLPSLEGQFLCVFQALGKTLVTNATRTPNGVSCTTPRNDLLPLIPANEHHFTSELSVRIAEGPDFVSTNFTFFGKIDF